MRARPLLLLPVLLVAACRSPETAAPGGTDSTGTMAPAPGSDTAAAAPAPVASGSEAQAWLAEAGAVDTTGDDYEALWARLRPLADRLDTLVGWKAACAREEGEATYEPYGPGGTYEVYPLAEGEALVTVVCYPGAYQSTYAVVRVSDAGARLVAAPHPNEHGVLSDPSPIYLGDLEVDPAGPSFSVFGRGRGIGDCGVYTTYRLDGNAARVEEARSRDCTDQIPDDLPPPSEWPVVYRTS